MPSQEMIFNETLNDIFLKIEIKKRGAIHIPNSVNDSLSKIALVLKNETKNMDFINVWEILYTFLSKKIHEDFSLENLNDKEGTLFDFYNAQKIEEIKRAIIDYLKSLPFDYQAIIPLISFKIGAKAEIEITEKIRIRFMPRSEAEEFGKEERESTNPVLRALSRGFKLIEGDQVYLIIDLRGYGSSIHWSPVYIEMETIIREILVSLFAFNIISGPVPQAFVREKPGFSQFNKDVIYAYLSKSNEKEKNPYELGLPFDLERWLASVEQIKEIEEYERKAIKYLIEDKNEETDRIKTSITWYGYSATNSNETFSYIQGVTAIEALLAVEQGPTMSKRLADRCGFLLGKTKKTRDKFADIFSEIYKKRSEIIHGSSQNLKHEDRELKYQLDILNKILIKTEIENYFSTKK